jgi:hypothetical protein
VDFPLYTLDRGHSFVCTIVEDGKGSSQSSIIGAYEESGGTDFIKLPAFKYWASASLYIGNRWLKTALRK